MRCDCARKVIGSGIWVTISDDYAREVQDWVTRQIVPSRTEVVRVFASSKLGVSLI